MHKLNSGKFLRNFCGKMKLVCATSSLFLGALLAKDASANICSVPVNMQPDGCTSLDLLGLASPDAALANQIFTSQCNTHDRCYATLGSSKQTCDANLRGDMRGRCDSVFNRWFDPGGWTHCKNVAEIIYQGLSNNILGIPQANYQSAQAGTVPLAQNIAYQVSSESCGMTAERTGYFASDAVAYVDAAFQSYAGRAPTTFEKFEALFSGPTIAGDANAWRVATNLYASGRAIVPVPSLNVSVTGGYTSTTFTLSANPSNAALNMVINGRPATVPSQTMDTSPSMYVPKIYTFRGYAIARHPVGGKEMKLIDTQVNRTAECNPICP